MTTVAEAMSEAARELRESARLHHRSQAAHKRQARNLMARLERLRRVCAEMGVDLVIEGEDRIGGQGHVSSTD